MEHAGSEAREVCATVCIPVLRLVGAFFCQPSYCPCRFRERNPVFFFSIKVKTETSLKPNQHANVKPLETMKEVAKPNQQPVKYVPAGTGPMYWGPGDKVTFLITGAQMVSGGAVSTISLGALGALPVALLVWVIGLSLGGPTGYAINPARDLGPRIMHALLPIAGKGDSDWAYSWVPVVGPVIGAAIAALLYLVIPH